MLSPHPKSSLTVIRISRLYLLIAICFLSVFSVSVAAAQDTTVQSKSADRRVPDSSAVVQGRVLDSLEKPLAGVDVIITDTRDRVIFQTKSSAKGTFIFNKIKSGSYRLSARSLGYQNARSNTLEIASLDTLDVEFILDPREATLAEVRVTASSIPAQYRITAEEIAKKPDRDALDIVLNRRIRMLGDTYKGCMPDTSTFTTDFRFIRKSPKLMGMQTGIPLRLFINGRWFGVRGIKDVLADIPAEDIAEINYVDCWDKERPSLRNTLHVVLKPGRRY